MNWADSRIVHQTTGRIRVRVPALRFNDELASPLAASLQMLNGVEDVRVNAAAKSVAIAYDADRTDAQALRKHVRGLSDEDLKQLEAAGELAVTPGDSPLPTWANLALSSGAVMLSRLGIGGALMPWLTGASAIPIFVRAWRSLFKQRRLSVDVLDASASTILSAQGQIPTAAFMIWLVNLADWIRDMTVHCSRRALDGILDYQSGVAWVVRDGEKIEVNVNEIQHGDTVVIYTGGRIPVDGEVVQGTGMVDQRTLTGESVPVRKEPADTVRASTFLTEGKLYVCAEQTGEETEAVKIVRMVEHAPVRETRVQDYAEKWADDLVPYSLAGAGATAFLSRAADRVASMLIIDYGTGIRVAAPTTVLASMTRAAHSGILIKGGRHLEELSEIDAMIFDKTGTLTTGELQVRDVLPLNGTYDADRLLSLAASAEQRLKHPVAEAIVKAAIEGELEILERTASDYEIGRGVEAEVNGNVVMVGSPQFAEDRGIDLGSRATEEMERIYGSAASPLCIIVDEQPAGMLALADPIRDDAAETLAELRARGLEELLILTGDHPAVAREVAQKLEISNYRASCMPGQKLEEVERLQEQGMKVAFVGDGINDSPALAHADIGIAMTGGTEVAQDTADVVLLHGGLWKIPLAMDISRQALDLLEENWRIISLPNSLAFSLASMGIMGPIGATLISNGSTIIAAANSLRPLLSNGHSKGNGRDNDDQTATTYLSAALNTDCTSTSVTKSAAC